MSEALTLVRGSDTLVVWRLDRLGRSLSHFIETTTGLEARGVPTKLLVFKDEGHGLVKLANKLVAYPAIVDFLDRQLKP